MTARPSVPELLERFRRYHAKHLAWGVLHVVLDDGNVRDVFVDCAIAAAERGGDEEGLALARILRQLSVTQRSKIARMA